MYRAVRALPLVNPNNNTNCSPNSSLPPLILVFCDHQSLHRPMPLNRQRKKDRNIFRSGDIRYGIRGFDRCQVGGFRDVHGEQTALYSQNLE
ncbi:hypothetical protein GW17_00006960 [Ensete ventricosum]|nr:hypothetical protein GW17_00006960 [Ensete ventricosum]